MDKRNANGMRACYNPNGVDETTTDVNQKKRREERQNRIDEINEGRYQRQQNVGTY